MNRVLCFWLINFGAFCISIIPLTAQEVKLTTEKILTIEPNSRTRFRIEDLKETGTYFLRAISQGESPIVFYVYENDPFTLVASNNTKKDTYEETLALPLNKDKTYQVIFSPLKANNSQAFRFSLVKSSLEDAFINLSSSNTQPKILPADESTRIIKLASFTHARPLISYSTAMHQDTLYLAYQDRVGDKVIVTRFLNGQWCDLGEAATGNQEKISSFKLAISCEGKVYLSFLSSPYKNQSKLNVVTYNGYHWVDISPNVSGYLADIFDFSIRGKTLCILYALILSKDSYSLQVITNQGFGREWFSLSPLEPAEKVSLEGLTLTNFPDLTIGYNSLSGKDKLSCIVTYRNSQWVNLEAPAQVNASLHSLVSTGSSLIFADITNKGVPALRYYHNNSWHEIPLNLEFTKPLSLSVSALKNGAIFLSLNSLSNFIVLVTKDRSLWQYVSSPKTLNLSPYSQFVRTDTDRSILSYQRGKEVIFEELQLK